MADGGVATVRRQRPSLTARGQSAPLLSRSATADATPPRKRLGGSRARRSQSVTQANIHLATPSMNSKGKISAMPRRRRSKDVKSSLPSIPSVDEDAEGADLGALPDMDWASNSEGFTTTKKDGEGSTGTETTMDSSSGSIDQDGSGGSGGRARGERPDMDWGSHSRTSSGSTASVKEQARKAHSQGSSRKGHGSSKKSSSTDLSGSGKGSNHNKKEEGNHKRRVNGASSSSRRGPRKHGSSDEEEEPKTTTAASEGSRRLERRSSYRDAPREGSRRLERRSSYRNAPGTPGGSTRSRRTRGGDPLRTTTKNGGGRASPRTLPTLKTSQNGPPAPLKADRAPPAAKEEEEEEKKPLGSGWFGELKDMSVSHFGTDEEYSSSESEDEDEEPQLANRSDESGDDNDESGSDDEEEDPEKLLASEQQGGKPAEKRMKPRHQRRPKQPTDRDSSSRQSRMRRSKSSEDVQGNHGGRRKQRNGHHPIRRTASRDGDNFGGPRKPNPRGPKRSQTFDETGSRRRRGGGGDQQREGMMLQVPATPRSQKGRSASKARPKSVAQKFKDAVDGDERRRPQRLISPFETEDPIMEPPPTPRRQGRRGSTSIPTAEELGYGAPPDAVPQTPRRRGRRASLGAVNRSGDGADADAMLAQSDRGARMRMSRRRVSVSQRNLRTFDDEEDAETHEDLLSSSERKMRTQRRPSLAQQNLVVDEAEDDSDEAVEDASANDQLGTRSERSERLRKRASQRNMMMEPMTPRRSQMGRQMRSMSVRSMKYDKYEDEEPSDNEQPKRGGLPTLGAHFASQNAMGGRGRRQARDDGSVSARSAGSLGCGTTRSRSRSRSSSRGGRYGYNGGQDRLCLSAVPSTPKKSVGLAALLYCKPLDLGGKSKSEDDDEKDVDFFDVSDSNDPADDDDDNVSVGDASVGEADDASASADKARAKKDYWKAKLAGKA